LQLAQDLQDFGKNKKYNPVNHVNPVKNMTTYFIALLVKLDAEKSSA
jgi:hypothetical protein